MRLPATVSLSGPLPGALPRRSCRRAFFCAVDISAGLFWPPVPLSLSLVHSRPHRHLRHHRHPLRTATIWASRCGGGCRPSPLRDNRRRRTPHPNVSPLTQNNMIARVRRGHSPVSMALRAGMLGANQNVPLMRRDRDSTSVHVQRASGARRNPRRERGFGPWL